MAGTRLTEDQWNATIRLALRATLNATGMAKTFPHKVLYGPDLYQALATYHPYFLQEIIHIMTISRSRRASLKLADCFD